MNFIRGEIKFDEPMSRHTTFKIGGPADIFVCPEDVDDLLDIIRYAGSHKMDHFIIGGGSKLLHNIPAQGVECMDVELVGTIRECLCETITHLFGCLVAEGNR